MSCCRTGTKSALSVEMEPLRSANDVGVLLQAMRQYPAGLPDRVSLIAAELPAYSTPQIALLLARLDTVGIGLVETSSRLADTGSQVHLLPPPTTCVVCGEPGLMVDRKPSGAVRPPSSPTVVSERGILQGILHSKTCRKCGALHGMSYADGGSGLPSGNVWVCVWVCVCVYVELLDQHLPWLARRFLEQAYVVAQRLEVG